MATTIMIKVTATGMKPRIIEPRGSALSFFFLERKRLESVEDIV